MSVRTPLLEEENTIEPDEPAVQPQKQEPRAQVVLTPTKSQQMATNPSDAESGIAGIFRQVRACRIGCFQVTFTRAHILVYLRIKAFCFSDSS